VLDVVEAVDELAYLNSILFHQSLSRTKGTGRPHQDWAVADAPTAKGTSQNGKAPGSNRTSSSFAVSGARAASYALDETVTASSFPAFTAGNVGDVGDEVRSNSDEVIETCTGNAHNCRDGAEPKQGPDGDTAREADKVVINCMKLMARFQKERDLLYSGDHIDDD